MYRRKLRSVLVGALAAGAAIGMSEALAQKSADTLRWSSDVPLSVADPYYNVLREGRLFIAQLVWDTLIYRDPSTSEYKPLLAQSWRWLDDTTLEIVLRRDVRFHDGKPLTSDDVAYTFDYVRDPKNKVPVISNFDWIDRTEVQDAHTIRLHLKAPFAPALEYLATLMPVMPNGFYSGGGAPIDPARLVGTGPYRIETFVSGQSIALNVNREYLRGGPKGSPSIGRIVYRTIPDRATQMAELLSGGLDWIWTVPKDQAATVAARGGLKVVAAETMRISFLAFNLDPMGGRNPFADKRVREAAAKAVDRGLIASEVIGPGASIAHTPCFRAQFGCEDMAVRWGYDPQGARRLLREAGHPNGIPVEVLGYSVRDRSEAVNGYLSESGLNAKLTQLQYPAAREKFNRGEAPIFHGEWGSYSINDVSAILDNFFTGSADDVYRDRELAEWLRQAKASIDPLTRRALYGRAIRRVTENLYWLPLFVIPVTYAHSSDLEFTTWPDENPRFFLARWK